MCPEFLGTEWRLTPRIKIISFVDEKIKTKIIKIVRIFRIFSLNIVVHIVLYLSTFTWQISIQYP